MEIGLIAEAGQSFVTQVNGRPGTGLKLNPEGFFLGAEIGAKGIVYGRNVIQHEKPTAMTQALMSIVDEGADAKTALAYLERN